MMSVASFTVAEEVPGPDGAAVWNHIAKVSPYTEWGQWADHGGMLAGRAPHGKFHNVFVNKQGLGSKTPPLQYGAIEVNGNYSPAKELKAITVMYKAAVYDPKTVRISGGTVCSGRNSYCSGIASGSFGNT
jgi:hypothetical protein